VIDALTCFSLFKTATFISRDLENLMEIAASSFFFAISTGKNCASIAVRSEGEYKANTLLLSRKLNFERGLIVVVEQNLLRRLEKLERRAKQIANDRSRFSRDCICFPEKEQPSFGFPIEGDIAFRVKCPLHGDRFKWPSFYIYVAKWMREKIWLIWNHDSPQYRKAWAASFPSDLWPAEEEETIEGKYLRLKDGTRLDACSRLYDESGIDQ